MKTILVGFVLAVCLLGITERGYSQSWISGYVYSQPEDNVIILQTHTQHQPYLAITNYTGTNATLGRRISVRVNRAGVYRYGDEPIELWQPADFVNKPPATPIVQAPALSPQELAKIKAQKQAVEEKRKQAAEASTVKWLQDQAAQGDASAECSLGERYLKGDGVDKDPTKAKDLLTKASAHGNDRAKDLLASIPSK